MRHTFISKSVERENMSMSPNHSDCLTSMSRIIDMQDLTLTAIIAAEKHTLM